MINGQIQKLLSITSDKCLFMAIELIILDGGILLLFVMMTTMSKTMTTNSHNNNNLCRILTSGLHTPLTQYKHPEIVCKLTMGVCRGLPCYAA